MDSSSPPLDLKEGPVKNRRCTDICFGFLFLFFLFAMVMVGSYGYSKGDPTLILYPFDSSGNQCGNSDYSTENYPYIYFSNPDDQERYNVCVEECPTENSQSIACFANTWVHSCEDGNVTYTDLANETHEVPVLKTVNFLQRLCLPVDDSKSGLILEKIKSAKFTTFGADFVRGWEVVLITVGIAVGISLVFLFILRYFVSLALWVSLVLVITAFGVVGYFLQSMALNQYSGDGHEGTRITLWALAVLFYALALLFLVLTICAKERIDLAVAIMKSAVMFIGDVWKSLLVPITILIISIGVTSLWLVALIYIYSSGTPKECTKCPTFGAVEWDKTLEGLFWFELAGIFWVNAFKIAATQFIIAYAVGAWYFTHKSEEGVVSPVWRGVETLFKYHLGSISLGSLIIGITLIFKFFMKLVVSAVRRGSHNPITKVLCLCCICCIGAVERLISFLDEGVYIRIALTGDTFCKSAKDSFKLILDNAGRFTVLSGVSSYFTFVGQVCIILVSTILGNIVLQSYPDVVDKISSPANLIFGFVIVSYVVSSIFLSVYEIACDTIIQSYIIDENVAKSVNLSAPQPLLEFMREYKEDPDEGCC